MRIKYDFGDLEAFLAVKETGSFHLAAQALNLSQSAITRRIQKLEAELDSVLFERTTRAVKPTLAAKRLQPRAEAILCDAQEMTLAIIDESVSMAHQRNALVTVAIIPSIVANVMPSAISRYRAQGHAARIRFLEFAANEVAEAVGQGEADFGLCSMPALEPNTQFEQLFDDQIGLALPSKSKLAQASNNAKHGIAWSVLEKEALIMPARGTGNRSFIDDAVAKQGLRLHWSFEVQRSATALDLVAGGCGVALLPRSAVESNRHKGVVYRSLEEPQISRPLGLLTRSGQSLTVAASELMGAIRWLVER